MEKTISSNDVSKLKEFYRTLKNVENYMASVAASHSAFIYAMWAFIGLLGYGFMRVIWGTHIFMDVPAVVKVIITLAFWLGFGVIVAYSGWRIFRPKYFLIGDASENLKKKNELIGKGMCGIWMTFGIAVTISGILASRLYGHFIWAYIVYIGLTIASFSMYMMTCGVLKRWNAEREHLIVGLLLVILSPTLFFSSRDYTVWEAFIYAVCISYLGGALYSLYSAEKYSLSR